jgi:hypothetical protein
MGLYDPWLPTNGTDGFPRVRNQQNGLHIPILWTLPKAGYPNSRLS